MTDSVILATCSGLVIAKIKIASHLLVNSCNFFISFVLLAYYVAVYGRSVITLTDHNSECSIKHHGL
jgi:hypothetical protein